MLNQSKKISKRFVTLRLYKPRSNRVQEMKTKVDTGAEANVMPLKEYRRMCPENMGSNGLPKPNMIERNEAVLKAYGDTVIKQIGRVHLPCEFKGLKFTCGFFLADVEGPILLGLPTCEALGIVKFINLNTASKAGRGNDVSVKGKLYVHPETPIDERPPIKSKPDLKEMYPECFTNVTNCFPNYEYHIELDHNAKPVVHAPRRIPLELKEKVKKKIMEMESENILAKVDSPTDWVNSMVVETKSDGRLRICLDPTDLNHAIKRDHYPVPSLEDLTPQFSGSDTFSKLDAMNGYWHVKLDEESSYLTTFNTPFGRYRYLRMPFGLNMSQDVFQRKIDEVYAPCVGALGIADDIAVHGKGGENHDLHLHAAMERSQKYNISLNYDKTLVKEKSIKFFGNVYSAAGVNPDPEKVSAIKALRPPECKEEMRTFLGMINYLQQFIPRLSENTEPFRKLIEENAVFTWDATYQELFEEIKKLVEADTTLSYYDRNKPVFVQCDASKQGLGCALVQEGRPIYYASKSLTETESWYAPIELEMLAVLYSVTKFHHYLYGRQFIVQSDHKPLQYIQRKNLRLAPPRLRGMLMKLWPYKYRIEHKPGSEMVLPDALTRLGQAESGAFVDLEVQINHLIDISKARYDEMVEETGTDEELTLLKKYIRFGWPASIKSLPTIVRPYWGLRDDLSLLDGLVMVGSRIAVPKSLRSKVLGNIHEGHQGIEKSKLRAKDAVYWPGIYKEVELLVGRCDTCLELLNAQPKCPMIPMEVPSSPWEILGADLFWYKSQWYLLITDYFSKFPVVRKVSSTAASPTVRAMKGVFSEYGIPKKVVSDNGGHFTAYECEKFAEMYDFEFVLSSPDYPRGHGLIERHIQTVKKCMKKCDNSGSDFELAMLNLRATPLSHNLPSPAELLGNRKLRTRLPTVTLNQHKYDKTRQKLKTRQETAEHYYNRNVTSKSQLAPGQSIRWYNKESSKWEPAKVVSAAENPRSYFIERDNGGRILQRNRQHLRSTVEAKSTPTDRRNPEQYEPTQRDVVIPASPHTAFGRALSPDLQDQQQRPVSEKNTAKETVSPINARPRRNCGRPDFYQST